MRCNDIYVVTKNEAIAKDVYKMALSGPTDCFKKPGQFVNIRIEGFYLRRPISVYRWTHYGFEIIYKVFGRGTQRLSGFGPGTELDVLTGLGNGFDMDVLKENPALSESVVLVGGGVGTPPLYSLAMSLLDMGIMPKVVLGFAGEEDVFCEKDFAALGCEVFVSVERLGSSPRNSGLIHWNLGLVTDVLAAVDYSYYYACGPMGMLKAVYKLSADKGSRAKREIKGQLSFEERMGCGFGACMGCTCQTLVGPKRVCEDGPVFLSEEVMFP